MEGDAIFTKLTDALDHLASQGVQELAVFGSFARDDQTEESDLDLLVSFSRPVGLFEFVRIKSYLEQITGRRVDLVTEDALRPEMKAAILGEALHVR